MKFDRVKYPCYDIIANGMMSIPTVGEGRLIPCLMIDKFDAKEVNELCKIHESSPPGDSFTTWVRPITLNKPKELILKIEFTSPMAIVFGVVFDISKNSNLIDGIFCSQSLHIETGLRGEKISERKNSGILIEVPRTNFEKNWESYFLDAIQEKYKGKGIPKNQIKELAKEHIKTTRQIWNYRRS